MKLSQWKLLSAFLAFALCATVTFHLLGARNQRKSAASVVTQVEKLSRLVTVRYRVQRVVGLKEQKDPIGEESILLMVEGEVTAGVDLHQVHEKDITFAQDGSATVALPPAAIFSAALDEQKTRLWDRHITWWTPWVAPDLDLEHKARLQAIEDVRQAALGMGILEQAAANARTALRDFFAALGLKTEFKTKTPD